MNLDTNLSFAGVDLGQAWRWWTSELRALLPARWRDSHARLVLHFEQDALIVSRRSADGAEQQWQRLDRADPALPATIAPLLAAGDEPALQLPASQVLSKTLDLPLAVEENLRQVLGFEMDRHTPFKAEQVYYDYRVLNRQKARQRLQVRLFIVPRRRLEEYLARLAEWGVQPVAVQPEQDAGINLLPAERRPRQSASLFTLNRLLILLAALLLLAAIALPLWFMRDVVLAIDQRLPEAQRVAYAVQALRTERDELLAEAQFLIDQKQSRPPVLAVLTELTRLLPDHTWLQSFQLNGDTLVIQGESPAASDLIALIEDSPYFQETGFRASVTKNPRTGLEGFQIATRLRSEPVP